MNSTACMFRFDATSKIGCTPFCTDANIPETTVFVSSVLEYVDTAPSARTLVATYILGNDTVRLLVSWRCDISMVFTVFVRTENQYDVNREMCTRTGLLDLCPFFMWK
jgi:hypothetical protein